MRSPEGCECGWDLIQVLDLAGAPVLRFIQLSGVRYYGGTTHDDLDLFYGPHIWLPLGGMFDLLARLADRKPPGALDWSFELERSGGRCYERVKITRHMNAQRLARALGCTEQQIRDHYGLVVKLA